MQATFTEHHTAWHRQFGKYTTCPWDCNSGEIVGETFAADAGVLAQIVAEGGRGIRCGSCKERHAFVETVKFCYEVKRDAETFERNDQAWREELAGAGTCVHGMNAALCAGPQHYPYDSDEQAAGYHNEW